MDTRRICVVETTDDLAALAWIAERDESARLAVWLELGGLIVQPCDLN